MISQTLSTTSQTEIVNFQSLARVNRLLIHRDVKKKVFNK